MATNKDEFSARLVQARSMKGWSQVDVANASGVAAAQISRYEQGSNTPRPQVVAKLATALGVSFSWLLSGAGEPVDPWLDGRATLRVELPKELIRRVEQSASHNRRLVDDEVQARLQASFAEPAQDVDRDVAIASSTAEAMLKALDRANEHGKLLLKKVEAIEARLIQPEGASLLKTGTPRVR